jgi:hypothetical protein
MKSISALSTVDSSERALLNAVLVDVESALKHLSALTTVAFTIRFKISRDKKRLCRRDAQTG